MDGGRRRAFDFFSNVFVNRIVGDKDRFWRVDRTVPATIIKLFLIALIFYVYIFFFNKLLVLLFIYFY